MGCISNMYQNYLIAQVNLEKKTCKLNMDVKSSVKWKINHQFLQYSVKNKYLNWNILLYYRYVQDQHKQQSSNQYNNFVIYSNMSKTIANKYEVVRVLGKGMFGKIYLTKKDGIHYSIKQKSKDKLKYYNLVHHTEQQLKILKQLKSNHLLELINVEQDQYAKYLVCEFCNVGNLFFYQGAFPNQVIPVQKVFFITSQLIKGLQDLHRIGHLHLNIKPQNILANVNNDQQTFKLMDFVLIRRKEKIIVKPPSSDIEKYMAPEQFQKQMFDEGADMWALGVVIYFMLTGEYPFNFRKYLYIKEIKKRYNPKFSYQQSLLNIEKKLNNTCTPEIEDFFRKIFQFQPQKRMNFHEIKQHPLLKQYFNINTKTFEQSKNLYLTKSNRNDLNPITDSEDPDILQNQMIEQLYLKGQLKDYQAAKDEIEFYLQESQFILEMSEQFGLQTYYLMNQIKFSLQYNLLKLYLIESKKLVNFLQKRKLPQKYSKHLKWDYFFQSPAFSKILSTLKAKINLAEQKFKKCNKNCQQLKDKIQVLLPKFSLSLNPQLSETSFSDFKIAYRTTTRYANNYLIQIQNKSILFQSLDKIDSKEFTILRVKILLCHALNRIFQKSELQINFKNYFSWKLQKKQELQEDPLKFNFRSFKKWLNSETKINLIQTVNRIWKRYFS